MELQVAEIASSPACRGLNVRMHCELCCSRNKESSVFVLDGANAGLSAGSS